MSFKPPTDFDFSKPEQWPTWRQRFLRYRTASKLERESLDVQTSALIYSMGVDADKIYNTFDIGGGNGADPQEQPDATFDDVIRMFNEHFTPKVIHERAIFHQRCQHSDGNVETYIRILYDLAEHADQFPDKDSAIRDRLVVGLTDRQLSEKLQLQPDLTLRRAIEIARQHEQVKVQMLEQRTSAVDAVHGKSKGSYAGGFQGSPHGNAGNHRHASRGSFHRNGHRGRFGQYSFHRGGDGSGQYSNSKCGRCGRDSHRKD